MMNTKEAIDYCLTVDKNVTYSKLVCIVVDTIQSVRDVNEYLNNYVINESDDHIDTQLHIEIIQTLAKVYYISCEFIKTLLTIDRYKIHYRRILDIISITAHRWNYQQFHSLFNSLNDSERYILSHKIVNNLHLCQDYQLAVQFLALSLTISNTHDSDRQRELFDTICARCHNNINTYKSCLEIVNSDTGKLLIYYSLFYHYRNDLNQHISILVYPVLDNKPICLKYLKTIKYHLLKYNLSIFN